MDKRQRYCSGSEYVPLLDTPEGHWFAPATAPAGTTRIAYCRPHVLGMQMDQKQLVKIPHSAAERRPQLNCHAVDHFPAQAGWLGLPVAAGTRNVTGVSVVTPDGRQTFPFVKPPVVDGSSVTLFPALPTQTAYAIQLGPGLESDRAWRILSMRVGRRPVNPFDTREPVYTTSSATVTIRGYSAGGTESFRFVASTPEEHAAAGAPPSGHNEDNIITLRLQLYRVERSRSSSSSSPGYYSVAYKRAGSFTVVRRAEEEEEGEAGEEGTGRSSDRTSRRVSSRAPRAAVFGFSAPAARSEGSQMLHGGTTASGGEYVEPIYTTSTTDRFVELDKPINITLQLSCWQPQADIRRDNRRAAIHAAGFDYHSAELAQLDERRERIMRRLKAIVDRYPEAATISKTALYDFEKLPPKQQATTEPPSPAPSKHLIALP